MSDGFPGIAGRRVLVTGGGSGIGRAVAQLLLDEGATVAVQYKGSREGAESLAPADRRLLFQADLLADSSCERLADAVIDDLGGLDALVNNAGVLHRRAATEMTAAEWDETLRLNLTVPFQLAQRALRHMYGAGGGVVVNVASIAGVVGGSMGPAYAASKGGLIALTKSLSKEAGPRGVRVNAVVPGLTRTDLIAQPGMAETVDRVVGAIPLGRLAEPAEIAGAVAYLCSDWATFANGTCLEVTGGQ